MLVSRAAIWKHLGGKFYNGLYQTQRKYHYWTIEEGQLYTAHVQSDLLCKL
jgi:hypothetical protein